MKKMNICFCGHFTGGGTERATFLLANELVKDYNIYIISVHSNPPFFYLSSEIKYDHLEKKNIGLKILELAKYLKKNNISVLISVEAMTGLYSVLAAKIAGCKHIIWEHANFFQNQGIKYIQCVRKLELLIVDYYIVLTKRDLNNFKNNFFCRCPIDYIYNIAEAGEESSYDLESKTIMSVGVVRNIKNFKIIPEIAKDIFQEYPDWVWKIYGVCKGKYAAEVENMILKYNLSDKVFLCGQCQQMDIEYKKASIYVLTSKMEGLPMVLLEARTHGLPMVSFDIETGPDEIIEDGVNGFLVPYEDKRMMTEKIKELIKCQDLRKKMSDMSRKDMEVFSKESISNRWSKILDDFS